MKDPNYSSILKAFLYYFETKNMQHRKTTKMHLSAQQVSRSYLLWPRMLQRHGSLQRCAFLPPPPPRPPPSLCPMLSQKLFLPLSPPCVAFQKTSVACSHIKRGVGLELKEDDEEEVGLWHIFPCGGLLGCREENNARDAGSDGQRKKRCREGRRKGKI